MKPSELIARLARPGTDEPLEIEAETASLGEPMDGWAVASNGQPVARLSRFKFDFNNVEQGRFFDFKRQHRLCRKARFEPKLRFVSPFDKIRYEGPWEKLGGLLMTCHGDDLSAKATILSSSRKVTLHLHAHGWSGCCRITRNGLHVCDIDLFNRETALRRDVEVINDTTSEMVITIEPTGSANPGAHGRGVGIEGYSEESKLLELPRYAKQPPVNKGGEFHKDFFEALEQLPSDGVALDVGGGKRQLADPRYLNLEYSAYVEPDLFGDALALPFRSNSIDLIYSAAVLEHVKDPLLAGREMYRVLKPGGLAIAGFAFMQPVHSEGQHFFNSTIWGAEQIFSGFEEKRAWAEGNFSSTVEWIADVLGIRAAAVAADWKTFEGILQRFDELIDPAKLHYAAAGIWVRARKSLA
jgi:hypothetical protein